MLANRLSADPKNRVLLLEAGGKDNWIWFHIPVGYLFAWAIRAPTGVPDREGTRPERPRAQLSARQGDRRLLGDQRHDLDARAGGGLRSLAPTRPHRLGLDDVLPVFRKLDDHFLGDTEHHGAGGEWRVEEMRVKWDVLDAVIDAASEMGIPRTANFNTGDNNGVGYFHVNQKRGVRMSTARAFLKPVLDRPNLRLETGVHVEKLLFEAKRCTGVRYRQNGRTIDVAARGEVVLSAGAVGSPQILQLSGVGPAEWLGEQGIPVVLDRQGVGRNLQDHLQQRAYLQGERRRDAQHALSFAVQARPDGPRIRAVPERAAHHGALAARHLHRVLARP